MIGVFWGFALLSSAMIANKIVLYYLPPILFVGIRMIGAGIILIAYQWKKTERFHWHYLKQDALILLTISLLTTLVPSILKAYALQHMPSAMFSLLGSIDPFVTALYTYILWHEKLSVSQLCGMLIGLAGLAWLIISTSWADIHGATLFSYPEMAAMAAPILGRLGWILVQYLLRMERYTAVEVNGVTMFMSGIVALMVSMPFETMPDLGEKNLISAGLALAYTIIVGNIIALTMYANFLKRHSVTFISLAGFSVNFFVALYGWILLKEVPPFAFFIALFITLIGWIIFYTDDLRRGRFF